MLQSGVMTAGAQKGAGEIDVRAAMAFRLHAVHLAGHELAIDACLGIGLQLAAHVDVEGVMPIAEQAIGIAAQADCAIFLEDKLTLFLAGRNSNWPAFRLSSPCMRVCSITGLGGFVREHLATGEQWQQGKAKRTAETHRGTPEKCAHVTEAVPDHKGSAACDAELHG